MSEFDYLSGLSVENLMNHTKKISGWQRFSGTEEELEAFRYMEEMLRSFGCRTELVLHDAYISLPVSSKLILNGEEVPSRTHSMVPTTEPDGIEGEVVYFPPDMVRKVPDGCCRGKIAAFEGRAEFGKVKEARRLGAIGLICIQEEPVRECIPSGAWGSPDRMSGELYSHIPIVSVSENDGKKLRQKKTNSYWAVIETKTDTRWRKIPSLTAQLDAPVKTEDFVMFSGHLDSWYYGAIDNGTVNAAQLEIARIAAMNRSRLKRNLRIVNFSGHSHGRYAGSAWYADEHWLELHEHCVVNVNGDSIGGKSASDITRSLIMPETAGLAKEIIGKLTGADFKGSRCRRVADQSFWNCGVSSAFASFSKQPFIMQEDGKLSVGKGNSELGWWWHTPEDTIDNVDSENFKRDASVFCAYIMEFLIRDILPLDYLKTAEEIKDALERWGDMAGGRFDLSREITMSGKLVEIMRSFTPDGEKANALMLKLGRILVPLLHTTGDIYKNDSAENYPLIPSLMQLEKLVQTEPESGEAMKLKVEITRKRNYVADSLNRAIRLLTGR